MGSGFADRRLLPLFAAAVMLGVAGAWPPLSHLLSSVQGSYNEGWNAYRQHAAMVGVPLYAANPVYYVTNYTPLSFHLVGWLGRAGMDLVLAGRLVSLASLMVVCGVCGRLAYLVGRVAWAGWFAAVLFWVWLAVFDPLQFGVDDPQLLGMAFLMLGLLASLRGGGWLAGAAVPAVLFSLALMVKQSFLPIPLCVGLHLVLTRQIRRLVAYAAAGVVCGGAMMAAAVWVDGPHVLGNLFFDRVTRWSWAVEKTMPFLGLFQVPMIAAVGVVGWQWRRSRAVQMLALAGLGSLLLGFVAVAGDGVNQNPYFDGLFIVCALAAGGAGLVAARWGGAGVGLAALLLVPGLVGVPTALMEARVAWRESAVVERDHAAALALLRAQAGPAICEHIKLCYDAGKAMTYDPFFVSDRLQLGVLEEGPILEALDRRCWGAVQLEMWRNDAAIGVGARPRFGAAFMAHLAAHYEEAYASRGVANGVAVYLARGGVGDGCAGMMGLPGG